MKKRIMAVWLPIMLTATVTAFADEPALPEITGIIGMTPVEAGSCIAVYFPMGSDDALSGVLWYNNDEQVVFPEVLVASGVEGSPEPVSAAFPVADDVSGASSGWSEFVFSEPIAATGNGFYVVFRLPEGSEHTAFGTGGGAGIGYTAGANGYTAWLSVDGLEWDKLHDDYGMAVIPMTVVAEEGMTEKSLDGGQELPITRTAMLLPAPNPFNPQTELRFQLKTASDVDLSIYSVRGERVAQLVSGRLEMGRYVERWDGTDEEGRRMASGTYLARFSAGHVVQTQRLLLVK